MKIFITNGKVNFVDKNNVLVGYDLEQSCCEIEDWYLSYEEELTKKENDFKDSVENYIFDTSYFRQLSEGFDGDEGGMVRFKLTNKEKPFIFLHIFTFS